MPVVVHTYLRSMRTASGDEVDDGSVEIQGFVYIECLEAFDYFLTRAGGKMLVQPASMLSENKGPEFELMVRR